MGWGASPPGRSAGPTPGATTACWSPRWPRRRSAPCCSHAWRRRSPSAGAPSRSRPTSSPTAPSPPRASVTWPGSPWRAVCRCGATPWTPRRPTLGAGGPGRLELQKRVWMPGPRTTAVAYTLLRAPGPAHLALVPLCAYRDMHHHTTGSEDWRFGVERGAGGLTVRAFAGATPYHLLVDVPAGRDWEFEGPGGWWWRFLHRTERARGQDDLDDLYAAGTIGYDLRPGETLLLLASTESPEGVLGLAPALRREVATALNGTTDQGAAGSAEEDEQLGAQLRRAAGQFLVARHDPGAPLARRPDGAPGGADGDRRLPLVRGLGPGHHDRPPRARRRHGALGGGGGHPARLRPLRRPGDAPQPLPRQRGPPLGGGLQHRGRHPVVRPGGGRDRPRPGGHADRGPPPRPAGDRGVARAGDALRDRGRPPGRPPAHRERAADLDGRPDRGLDRHPPGRQAGGAGRPVAPGPRVDGRLGLPPGPAGPGGPVRRAAGAGGRRLPAALLVPGRGVPLRRGGRAPRGTTPVCAPTRSSPPPCRTAP